MWSRSHKNLLILISLIIFKISHAKKLRCYRFVWFHNEERLFRAMILAVQHLYFWTLKGSCATDMHCDRLFCVSCIWGISFDWSPMLITLMEKHGHIWSCSQRSRSHWLAGAKAPPPHFFKVMGDNFARSLPELICRYNYTEATTTTTSVV